MIRAFVIALALAVSPVISHAQTDADGAKADATTGTPTASEKAADVSGKTMDKNTDTEASGAIKTTTKKSKTKSGAAKDKAAAKGEKTMSGNPIVHIETSMGGLDVELFADKAPISVKNFLRYADEGFFNGTIFHRVINNFMIQGGGFTPDLKQKDTHEPIKNEATNGLKNDKGTLAMARTGVVDSATAQFFINVKDNGFLDHQNTSAQGYGYAVFGKVIKGLDVVEKIKAVPTGHKGMYDDVPETAVVITAVTRK